MPDLTPGAMSPPLDDGLPAAPQRLDVYDARRAAEALRELEAQHERDPERPRTVWERRYNEWTAEWEDVAVGTLSPRAGPGSEQAPLAEQTPPRADAPLAGEGLPEGEEQEPEGEGGAWLGRS
jgi:hypothetical protein